jgi:integrase
VPAYRRPTPSYLHHGSSDRARAVWTDGRGKRHFRLLPGKYGSAESRSTYARLLLELDVAPHHAELAKRNDLAVAEVLDAYREFALKHYRQPDGRLSSTIHEVQIVVRALDALYGEMPAAVLGPLAIKTAMQQWVVDGCSRVEVNRRLGVIKRVFKWAASEELVPASVFHSLAVVSGLKRGRTTAPETEPVAPVDDSTVIATLPYLNRFVRGLVEFQRHTGCRPAEACAVRRCDIDTGGRVWLFCPTHHKNLHRGQKRVIAIGPKAQKVLKRYFTANLTDYLFSPRRAMEDHQAERAAERVTPRWPSHKKRNATKRKAFPRRAPTEKYDSASYRRAVDRAIVAANAARLEEAKNLGPDAVKRFKEIPHWAPNQLRHTFATFVRKQHGIEAAQVLLGHTQLSTTQIYAEKNEALAITLAAKLG